MLVLKRKREQSVRIGPDVVVKIIAIQNGAVTLAITAPSSFKIIRDQTLLNGVNDRAEDEENTPTEDADRAAGPGDHRDPER